MGGRVRATIVQAARSGAVIEHGFAELVEDGRKIRAPHPQGINQRRFVMAVGGYSSSMAMADGMVISHLAHFRREGSGVDHP